METKINTNLLLNFSNVFNDTLTICRNKMFDNNSVFDEFENILYLLKIFSNGFDKYKAVTHFVKNSRYSFCDDFPCEYEMVVDFKRKVAYLFKHDGNKSTLINQQNFQAA
ncbi:MAG: hypothetical protein IJM09_03760 [Neisseriaceae bacterium]|nr:hypothetical protein [Neisseriaceae bacterium]